MTIKDFGIYLKSLRAEKNLTLLKLAELSNVSHSYLSQVENGKRGTPSPDILKKLSPPLGIDPDILMKKAGYISENLMLHDSLEYTASKIVISIMEVLREIKSEHKFTENEVNKFHADLIKAYRGDGISFSDLRAHLYDMEPNNERVNNLGNEEQTEKIERLLDLLNKVSDDDNNIRLLKKEQENANELIRYLDQPEITYNGYRLTKEEREQLLDMLQVLFKKHQ